MAGPADRLYLRSLTHLLEFSDAAQFGTDLLDAVIGAVNVRAFELDIKPHWHDPFNYQVEAKVDLATLDSEPISALQELFVGSVQDPDKWGPDLWWDEDMGTGGQTLEGRAYQLSVGLLTASEREALHPRWWTRVWEALHDRPA